MISLISESPRETEKIAENLTQLLPRGSILAISGSLGSGKTVFVKGLAKGLKIRGKITSPTFIICCLYRNPSKRKLNLAHFDLYRIEKPKLLFELGFSEILNDPRNLTAIEWAENAKSLLPKRAIFVELQTTARPNQRIIKIF